MGRQIDSPRRYDSRARAERALQSREAIVETARRAFLEKGYAATTVAMIASLAGVSVETIYKSVGGKPGLVRAVYERGLAGRGPKPASERSDAMSAATSDPREIIRQWGALTSEVSPLVSPILLLVRAAALTDSDLAALLAESDAQRLTRMRQQACMLGRRGFLRKGVSVESAADVMWIHTSPELYELLVVRRGWSAKELGDHVARTLIAALLAP